MNSCSPVSHDTDPMKSGNQRCFPPSRRSAWRVLSRWAMIVPGVVALLGTATAQQPDTQVKPGIDVLRDSNFEILRGKRIGLVTNPTGIASDLQTTVDILSSAPGVNVVALFGPEHGVRGDVEAGRYVETYRDPSTGIPVYSLYGRTRKPTPEMLRGIDCLVYDIQDIGVRSYTYISTLGLIMEAAADVGIPVIVLDRPDPLGGDQVGGPILETRYKSFVGAFPIPYVYGLTTGELAQMINGERWLEGDRSCELFVVPMKGWKRWMLWSDTGLLWVPTSPHIPHSLTTQFYVLTGLLGELGTANQGVGYTLPFELIGAPWMNGERLAAYLNRMGLQGVVFRPLWYKPFYFDTSDIQYKGVQIHITDAHAIDLTRVQMHILAALMKVFPDWNIFTRSKPEKFAGFTKIIGTSDVYSWLNAGITPDEIVDRLNRSLASFVIKREKYLMYE